MRLKDKVAIITGGGRGIGRAYALRLAEEGAKVVIAEIVFENAQKVAKEIEAKGGEALPLHTDISDEASTMEMAKRTVERFGGIDILLNNASIFYGLRQKPFDELTVEEWDRLFAVNVRGTFLCCKAAVPYMKAKGKGKIINISSGTFFLGSPLLLHYLSSKGAIIAMTRGLARELGESGINVNCLAPGFTLSEAGSGIAAFSPGVEERIISTRALKRNEKPDDLVGTALFLASEDSDFLTGVTICVDGGQTMH